MAARSKITNSDIHVTEAMPAEVSYVEGTEFLMLSPAALAAAEARRKRWEEETQARELRERRGRLTDGVYWCGLSVQYFNGRKTLANYEAKNDSQARARDAVSVWPAKFPARWIWLHSKEPGLGKTHLLGAALAQMIVDGSFGRFVTVSDLMIEARNFSDGAPDPTGDAIRRYSGTPILILDDVGAEKPSDFTIATLSVLINRRYEARRPTAFSSNFSLAELGERLAVRGEEIAAKRIVDRIYEMTGGAEGAGRLELKGKSHRKN